MRHTSSAFTLVEIMITVAVIGILAMIATPHYLRARETSHRVSCMENMKKIQGAKELYAINASGKSSLSWNDILPYLQRLPVCPAGGKYEGWEIAISIYCTVHDWRNNSEYAGYAP